MGNAMSEKCVLVEIKDRIATVSLNRPEAANGLNLEMAQALAAAAGSIDADPSIKAVILTATGRFFCAGGDLKAMLDTERPPAELLKEIADNLHRAIAIFERMAPPVIVAINGVAAGAGFSLAATGDMALAASSASFMMAYTRAGLSPDGSSSYYLPRLIGLRKTKELMLTNRKLTAEEAVEWGILNEVVADDELQSKAREYAEMFVQGAKGSNAAVKQLLCGTFKNGLEEQMELESRTIAACLQSADGQEGVQAFIDKRAPVFK